jgi:hypothetical protein
MPVYIEVEELLRYLMVNKHHINQLADEMMEKCELDTASPEDEEELLELQGVIDAISDLDRVLSPKREKNHVARLNWGTPPKIQILNISDPVKQHPNRFANIDMVQETD